MNVMGRGGLGGMDWKSFCEGISAVKGTWDVLHDELELSDAVAQPVEAHVHSLAALGLHRVGGQPDSHVVVAVERGWGLGVAEVMLGAAEVGGYLGIAV